MEQNLQHITVLNKQMEESQVTIDAMCEVNNKLLTKVNSMTEQIDQLQSTVREKEVVIALNKNQVETIKSELEGKLHEESMRRE